MMRIQDEAYELGSQWANLYDADSPSRQVIKDLMETSFLVNVVHNDFKDPSAIFKPFIQAGENYAAQKSTPNGATTIAVNGVNGVH